MGLTTMNQNRAILITGKIGTGKSTKALTLVKEPMIVFANDIDIDVGSFPVENGIIIEDVHYKPDKQAILFILRNYRGQIILTSINEKSVPKEIKDKSVPDLLEVRCEIYISKMDFIKII